MWRTLIVKRLYGNIRGIKLKKLSSYSFSLIALSATAPSMGRIPGGNLPFVSQFSAQARPRYTHEYDRAWNEYTPFEIATLSSSIAASRSGWKGCCDKGCQKGAGHDDDWATLTMSTIRRFFFPFGLSAEPLVLRFPEFSSPSDKSAMGVSFEPCECEESACVCK